MSRPIRTLALLLAVAACGSEPSETEPTAPLPDPLDFPVGEQGPFNAGYRSFETSYTSPTDGTRSIVLNLWYPTAADSGPTPTYSMLFSDDDVFDNAKPLPPAYAAGFPVIVHSHGHRGFGGNSAELMRHFATHGWLVVAPDHKDNTLLNSPDEPPPKHYFERLLDVRAALDALESDSALAGKLDMGSVVLTGHSFGTYTAWGTAGAAFDVASIQTACDAGQVGSAVCTPDEVAVFSTDLSEPRLKAAIPMAGGARETFFGVAGYDAVDIPMLLMTGSDDDVGAQALFDLVSDVDLTWIDVAGGCHQLFGFGDCPLISNDEGFPIVNSHALAFARLHGLGDASVAGIVDGSEPVSSKVTLAKK
jgi:predicted dienelactone hydrolase